MRDDLNAQRKSTTAPRNKSSRRNTKWVRAKPKADRANAETFSVEPPENDWQPETSLVEAFEDFKRQRRTPRRPEEEEEDQTLIPPMTLEHRKVAISTQANELWPWIVPQPVRVSEGGQTWMTTQELEGVLRTQLAQMERANTTLTRPQTIAISSSSSPESFGKSSYSSARGPREILNIQQDPVKESQVQRRNSLSPVDVIECACGLARLSAVMRDECPGLKKGTCSKLQDLRTDLEACLAVLAFCKEADQTVRRVRDQPMVVESASLEASQLLFSLFQSVSEFPAVPDILKVSMTRPARRLSHLAAANKGLRLVWEVWHLCLTTQYLLPQEEDIPTSSHIVARLPMSLETIGTFLFAVFRNSRFLTVLCQHASSTLFFDTFYAPMFDILSRRSGMVSSEEGDSALDGLKAAGWRLFTEIDANIEDPHLCKIWLHALFTICRLCSDLQPPELGATLAALCRVFLQGHGEWLRESARSQQRTLSAAHLEGCCLCPDDRTEGLLGRPTALCLFLCILLGLQLSTVSRDSDEMTEVATIFADPEADIESRMSQVSDWVCVYSVVCLIGRIAVRQSLRLEGVLTGSIFDQVLAPVSVTVFGSGSERSLVPAASCVFAMMGGAILGKGFESSLSRSIESNGAWPEQYLLRLHQLFSA